jgi:hypothetical protein
VQGNAARERQSAQPQAQPHEGRSRQETAPPGKGAPPQQGERQGRDNRGQDKGQERGQDKGQDRGHDKGGDRNK